MEYFSVPLLPAYSQNYILSSHPQDNIKILMLYSHPFLNKHMILLKVLDLPKFRGSPWYELPTRPHTVWSRSPITKVLNDMSWIEKHIECWMIYLVQASVWHCRKSRWCMALYNNKMERKCTLWKPLIICSLKGAHEMKIHYTN